MGITANLLGLSLGTVSPSVAMVAILLGTAGYALAEHEAEQRNDARPLLVTLALIVFGAWAVDVRADDGPIGIAGPVLELVLGAALAGSVWLAIALRRLLEARSARSRRRLVG